jgi:hypothetical protein
MILRYAAKRMDHNPALFGRVKMAWRWIDQPNFRAMLNDRSYVIFLTEGLPNKI